MISETLILFRSEFSRFCKSSVFRKDVTGTAVIFAVLIIFEAVLAFTGRGTEGVSFMGIALAVFFCSPFVPAFFIPSVTGTEFECGAVRNKLISGYSRNTVYFGGLLSSAAALTGYVTCTMITDMLLLCIASSAGTGSILIFLAATALVIVIMLPSVSVCYALTIILGNKNHAVNICMITTFLSMLASILLFSMDVSDSAAQDLFGLKEVLITVIPSSQVLRIIRLIMDGVSGTEIIKESGVICAVNLGITLISSFTGAAVFRKKDIK